MAKPGPKRKPKEILKLSGTWRGKQRGDEPKAESATKLKCPAWLKPKGKTAWRKVVKQMAIMGILTMADENLIARYAQTWANWRDADAFIADKGVGYPIYKDGKVVSVHKYPHTAYANQLLSELTRMESLMGMSPSARASLAVDNKNNKVSNESKEKSRFFATG